MKCWIMHCLQTVKRVDEMPHNALFANSEELDEMQHNALFAKIKKLIFTTEMHHDLENFTCDYL